MYPLSLDLSTALSWSQATLDCLVLIVTIARNGHDLGVEVNGAIKIVLKMLFMGSGDITTHGRILRISAPTVGSGLNQ